MSRITVPTAVPATAGAIGCISGRPRILPVLASDRTTIHSVLRRIERLQRGDTATVLGRGKAWFRISGLFAGALALAFLWAANRLDEAVPFPPFSLAERLIRITPGDVATFFIERLQHNALRLLAAGVTVAFLALALVLPEASGGFRRPRPLLAGLVFAALTGAVALSAPVQPSLLAVILSTVAAGALYALSLAWLIEVAASYGGAEANLSRRRALGWIAGAALGVVLGSSLLARVAGRLGGPNTNVAIGAPVSRARIPDRPPFADVPGLSPEVTSVADHYVVDIDLVDPSLEADGWLLSVKGVVDRPLKLTFHELQRRFELVEEYSVLTCVSNPVGGPLIGSSKWTGVRLRDVLTEAGPGEGAVDVAFRCADGYTTSIPVELALDRVTLLAIAQNGRPLRQEHGFPCRVRAPAVYGMLNAKWLEEIEVVDSNFKGYWTKRGWSDTAIVRTESRIDSVGESGLGRPTWIAGVAWAGVRGISAVEVSVDGGRTWRSAQLHRPLSRLAWTQWAYRWVPTQRGSFRVLCRAVDGNGEVQDPKVRPPHPSGASGYHEVRAQVT